MTAEKQGLWEERGGEGKERESPRVGGEDGPGRTAGKTDEGGQFVSFCGQLECPRQN